MITGYTALYFLYGFIPPEQGKTIWCPPTCFGCHHPLQLAGAPGSEAVFPKLCAMCSWSTRKPTQACHRTLPSFPLSPLPPSPNRAWCRAGTLTHSCQRTGFPVLLFARQPSQPVPTPAKKNAAPSFCWKLYPSKRLDHYIT